MVRLMLVLAPVACILSGISVSTVLTTYMKVSCLVFISYFAFNNPSFFSRIHLVNLKLNSSCQASCASNFYSN